MSNKINEEELTNAAGGSGSSDAESHKGNNVDQYQVKEGVKYVFAVPVYDHYVHYVGVCNKVFEESIGCGHSIRRVTFTDTSGATQTITAEEHVFEYID